MAGREQCSIVEQCSFSIKVQQTYFSFSLDLHKEFKDVYKRSFRRLEFVAESDLNQETFLSFTPEESFEINVTPLIGFAQKYNHRLSIKPFQELGPDDAIEYTFVLIAIKLLSLATGEHFQYHLDPDKIKMLEDIKKRTGFLQAILAGMPITVYHKGGNEKANRQYVTGPMRVNDKQFVYMILIDGDILSLPDWLDQVNELTEDFESRLENLLSKDYTKDRKKKGEVNDERAAS